MRRNSVRSILVSISLGCSISIAAMAQYSAQPTTNLPSPFPTETNRPVSINGRVVIDDGTPVTESVEIQRVCGNIVRRDAYTDSHGKFNITIDSRTNSLGQGASEGGGASQMGAQMGDRTSQTTRTQLWNCELRAVLVGYVSNTVSLGGHDFSTPVDVGSIILHRNSAAAGGSISVTSAKAPDEAKKELDKAREYFNKKKYEDADKHAAKAVELYPQFATALELRGRAQRLLKKDDEARKMFLDAITADEKFIPSYIQLAGLDAAHGHWPQVAIATAKVIELDPLNYPDAYFLNAFAHHNLQETAEAEASARKAVELDKSHRFPRASLLLGKILQAKGDDAGAAESFRNYLKLEPASAEAASLQAYIAKVSSQSAAAPKSN